MKLSHDQRGGLPPLLIILLVLLIALLGFAGWKVWDNNRNNQKVAESSETAVVEEDVAIIQPASGLYGVALPAGWVTNTCSDGVDILMLAPNEELLGACNTESFGTVSITANEGDGRESESVFVDDPMFSDVTYNSDINVNGLPGVKVSYTVAEESLLGYPPVGTHIIMYQLYDSTNGQTYIVAYRQLPDQPDNTAIFTEIVESFELV